MNQIDTTPYSSANVNVAAKRLSSQHMNMVASAGIGFQTFEDKINESTQNQTQIQNFNNNSQNFPGPVPVTGSSTNQTQQFRNDNIDNFNILMQSHQTQLNNTFQSNFPAIPEEDTPEPSESDVNSSIPLVNGRINFNKNQQQMAQPSNSQQDSDYAQNNYLNQNSATRFPMPFNITSSSELSNFEGQWEMQNHNEGSTTDNQIQSDNLQNQNANIGGQKISDSDYKIIQSNFQKYQGLSDGFECTNHDSSESVPVQAPLNQSNLAKHDQQGNSERNQIRDHLLPPQNLNEFDLLRVIEMNGSIGQCQNKLQTQSSSEKASITDYILELLKDSIEQYGTILGRIMCASDSDIQRWNELNAGPPGADNSNSDRPTIFQIVDRVEQMASNFEKQDFTTVDPNFVSEVLGFRSVLKKAEADLVLNQNLDRNYNNLSEIQQTSEKPDSIAANATHADQPQPQSQNEDSQHQPIISQSEIDQGGCQDNLSKTHDKLDNNLEMLSQILSQFQTSTSVGDVASELLQKLKKYETKNVDSAPVSDLNVELEVNQTQGANDGEQYQIHHHNQASEQMYSDANNHEFYEENQVQAETHNQAAGNGYYADYNQHVDAHNNLAQNIPSNTAQHVNMFYGHPNSNDIQAGQFDHDDLINDVCQTQTQNYNSNNMNVYNQDAENLTLTQTNHNQNPIQPEPGHLDITTININNDDINQDQELQHLDELSKTVEDYFDSVQNLNNIQDINNVSDLADVSPGSLQKYLKSHNDTVEYYLQSLKNADNVRSCKTIIPSPLHQNRYENSTHQKTSKTHLNKDHHDQGQQSYYNNTSEQQQCYSISESIENSHSYSIEKNNVGQHISANMGFQDLQQVSNTNHNSTGLNQTVDHTNPIIQQASTNTVTNNQNQNNTNLLPNFMRPTRSYSRYQDFRLKKRDEVEYAPEIKSQEEEQKRIMHQEEVEKREKMRKWHESQGIIKKSNPESTAKRKQLAMSKHVIRTHAANTRRFLDKKCSIISSKRLDLPGHESDQLFDLGRMLLNLPPTNGNNDSNNTENLGTSRRGRRATSPVAEIALNGPTPRTKGRSLSQNHIDSEGVIMMQGESPMNRNRSQKRGSQNTNQNLLRSVNQQQQCLNQYSNKNHDFSVPAPVLSARSSSESRRYLERYSSSKERLVDTLTASQLNSISLNGTSNNYPQQSQNLGNMNPQSTLSFKKLLQRHAKSLKNINNSRSNIGVKLENARQVLEQTQHRLNAAEISGINDNNIANLNHRPTINFSRSARSVSPQNINSNMTRPQRRVQDGRVMTTVFGLARKTSPRGPIDFKSRTSQNNSNGMNYPIDNNNLKDSSRNTISTVGPGSNSTVERSVIKSRYSSKVLNPLGQVQAPNSNTVASVTTTNLNLNTNSNLKNHANSLSVSTKSTYSMSGIPPSVCSPIPESPATFVAAAEKHLRSLSGAVNSLQNQICGNTNESLSSKTQTVESDNHNSCNNLNQNLLNSARSPMSSSRSARSPQNKNNNNSGVSNSMSTRKICANDLISQQEMLRSVLLKIKTNSHGGKSKQVLPKVEETAAVNA